jgi:magnesium transporter
MNAELHPRKLSHLEALTRALDQGTMRQVHRLVNSMHPAEVASLLESLPPAQREVVWDLVDPELEGDVLVELNEEVRAGLISEMETEELVAATEGLEADDLADLLQDLPEAVNRRVLRSMDAQDRERLRAMLAYDEDTAGGLMNTDTVSVRPDVTLETVLRYLRMRGELPEKTDSLFVVNRYDRYLGVLEVTRLLTEDPERTVGEVMDTQVVGIAPDTPANRVANLFEDCSELPWARAGCDRLLLDPPRAGAESACRMVDRLGPSRVVYVSCHPATLARDAGILVHEHGFTCTGAGVMDMFPHTTHVESIAVFDRR